MKILIIGNIGSGKTTLGKKIQEITGFKFVQIDDLREKYLRNAVSEEYYCLYQFVKQIEKNKDIILEFTGAGCHKFAIKKVLELSKLKAIIIVCLTRDFSTIEKRAESKKFSYEPIFPVDVKEHIHFVDEEIQKDLSEKFWENAGFEVLRYYMDDLNDLTNNVEDLRKIIKNELLV